MAAGPISHTILTPIGFLHANARLQFNSEVQIHLYHESFESSFEVRVDKARRFEIPETIQVLYFSANSEISIFRWTRVPGLNDGKLLAYGYPSLFIRLRL